MDGETGTATRIGVAGIVGKGKGDDVVDRHLRALVIPTARVVLSVALQQIRPHDISLHFMEIFKDHSLSPCCPLGRRRHSQGPRAGNGA